MDCIEAVMWRSFLEVQIEGTKLSTYENYD
jgi:hypothetical protein